MRTATGEVITNTTSFPFKLKGSVTERVNVARVGEEYIFCLEPDPARKVVHIEAGNLRAKIDKTQDRYGECGRWQRLRMSLAGRWFCEEVDTSAGYIKVGCPAKDVVQMNLPITLTVTEYLYDPISKPRPHVTSGQANILVSLENLQKALHWCDAHQNELPAQRATL